MRGVTLHIGAVENMSALQGSLNFSRPPPPLAKSRERDRERDVSLLRLSERRRRLKFRLLKTQVKIQVIEFLCHESLCYGEYNAPYIGRGGWASMQ